MARIEGSSNDERIPNRVHLEQWLDVIKLMNCAECGTGIARESMLSAIDRIPPAIRRKLHLGRLRRYATHIEGRPYCDRCARDLLVPELFTPDPSYPKDPPVAKLTSEQYLHFQAAISEAA